MTYQQMSGRGAVTLGILLLTMALTACGTPDNRPKLTNDTTSVVRTLSLANPVDLIVDTDIEGDVDDAGALAVAHALADNGEINLLAVMVDTVEQWGAPAVDVINTYYGRPDIPIGQYKVDVVRYPNSVPPMPTPPPKDYTQYLTQNFPSSLKSGVEAPDATTLYRQILASRPDNSVTIAAIGFLNNLSNLLESKADQYSDLAGPELVRRKVKLLTIMGGCFPGIPSCEDNFNWGKSKQAAAMVLNNWPNRIIFSSYGTEFETGPRLTRETLLNNPVRKAYELFPGIMQTRPSWDQVAVLAASRPLAPYFTEGRIAGSIIDYDANTGRHTFISSPTSPAKDQSWLVQAGGVSDASLTQTIEDLMVQPPALRPVADGVYRIVAKASGKVLDLKDASAADGAQAWQYPWIDGDNQRWRFQAVGSGYYRITAQHSGKVLAVNSCSGVDQAQAQQDTWVNNDCQKWKVDGVGGGTYRLTNKSSGKVLDLAYCSTADQATIWQISWLDNDCQRWKLQPVSPNSVPSGTYQIIAKHSGKVLDVKDVSTSDGATVWQFGWLNGANQQWTMVPTSDGYYQIIAKHSGKVLDVQNISYDESSPILQYPWLNGENQRFAFEALGGGYYRITAKHSGKVFDIANASTGEGAALWQHSWLGTDNQKWQLNRLGP